jgi:predicted PurR-regulated permease PerM
MQQRGNHLKNMNTITKYILGFVALVAAIFFSWYFFSVIIYILVAAVISFIGKPIIDLLSRVKFRGHYLPGTAKAAITVICLWLLFILFFVTIIPLAVREFQSLGNVSVSNIVSQLQSPIDNTGHFLKHYGLLDENEDVNAYITRQLSDLFNIARLKIWFRTVVGTVSDIFVALFSITFILFFFLKDSRLFSGMVLAIVPSRYEEQARNALDSIQKLLVRYFVGLLLEVLGVMTLNTAGMTFVGFDFNHALVIGLVTGILNVIPYIGPLIGICFGLAVGVVLNLDMEFYHQMLPLLIYQTVIMSITQLIDNVVFQPYIYGNSVYAHPLEIFLVILMAGSLAGIPGMILAIPSYTVIRVILKEFFNKYKLVKKLTQSLNER